MAVFNSFLKAGLWDWFADSTRFMKDLEKTVPLIEQIKESCGVASISVGVLHNNQVVFTRSIGYRDVERQIPPDEDTMYLVISVSKTFVSAAIGILVEEGKLQWTDLISK